MNLGISVPAHAGFGQSQASHFPSVLQARHEADWRLRHDISTQPKGVAAALGENVVVPGLAVLGPLASRHA